MAAGSSIAPRFIGRSATSATRRAGWRLYGLAPEMVAADQRRRILAALPGVVCRSGYDRATVEQIIARAGVSRRTFYDLFTDKDEAFRAAHALALRSLVRRVRAACGREDRWPSRVAAAVRALLEWASEEPDRALLISAQPLVAGPHTAYSHDRLILSFAPALQQRGARRGVELCPPQDAALIAAVAAVVARHLIQDCSAPLVVLAPQLTEFVHSFYLEPREAHKFATTVEADSS